MAGGPTIANWGQLFGEFQIGYGPSGAPPIPPTPSVDAVTGGAAMGPRGAAELKALLGWHFIEDDELMAIIAAIDDGP